MNKKNKERDYVDYYRALYGNKNVPDPYFVGIIDEGLNAYKGERVYPFLDRYDYYPNEDPQADFHKKIFIEDEYVGGVDVAGDRQVAEIEHLEVEPFHREIGDWVKYPAVYGQEYKKEANVDNAKLLNYVKFQAQSLYNMAVRQVGENALKHSTFSVCEHVAQALIEANIKTLAGGLGWQVGTRDHANYEGHEITLDVNLHWTGVIPNW